MCTTTQKYELNVEIFRIFIYLDLISFNLEKS